MRLFSIMLVAFAIILAGCSEQDCSTLDTTYEKYGLDEETGECTVVETIEENVCGNGVIEDGETYCSCSEDVSETHPTFGCTGGEGEFLENTCNTQDECVLVQNDKVVKETKVVEFKNSDLTLEGEFTLYTPYIINVEDEKTLDVAVSLFKKSSFSGENIKNIKVQSLKIENSQGTLLASKEFNNAPLTNIGDQLPFASMQLADTTERETRVSLRAELVVSYTEELMDSKGEVFKTENKIENLRISLGYYDIINPVFEED